MTATYQQELLELVAAEEMVPMPYKVQSALSDLLGAEFTGGLFGAFRDMEIAEEEIALAIERHPEQRDAIWDSFQYCMRGPVLGQAPEKVYRSHMRELIERVAAGASDKEINDATNAEICWMLKDLALIAPLNADGFYLYYTCFSAAFPEDAPRVFAGMDWTPRESWVGRGEELRQDVARKVVQRLGKGGRSCRTT